MSLQFFIDWKLFLEDQRNIFKTVCRLRERPVHHSLLSSRFFHSSIPDISLHVSSTSVPPNFGIIKRLTGVILLEKIIPLQNFLVRDMHNRYTTPINDETRWNFSTRFPMSLLFVAHFIVSGIFDCNRYLQLSNEFLGSLTNNLRFKMKLRVFLLKGKEIILLVMFYNFTTKIALI